MDKKRKQKKKSKKFWEPYRLRKTPQFKQAIEEGQKVVNSSFIVYLIESGLKNFPNCQFGIAVPKSLVEGAVERNLYKRQIRNMLIFNLKNHNDSCQIGDNHSHCEIVIIIRPSYLENDFRTNQRKLYGLLLYAFQNRSANLLPERPKKKTFKKKAIWTTQKSNKNSIA